MLRRRTSDDRGAMTVLLAASLVALLGLTGLVIDGGRAYAGRRGVQNAADAAALAGAGALNEILFDTTRWSPAWPPTTSTDRPTAA